MSHSGDQRPRGTWILYLLGAVLILTGVGTALYNTWPDIAFEGGLVREAYPYVTNFETSTSDEASLTKPVTKLIAETTARSRPADKRIVIPRIGVNVPIFEGDANRGLRLGVYRHKETAKPGERGNMAIAGHRNRRRFALLYRLRPGDRVMVYWSGKEYDYEVERVFGINPSENEVLRRGSAEKLTLYTCKPRFLGNLRTVVTAKRVFPGKP